MNGAGGGHANHHQGSVAPPLDARVTTDKALREVEEVLSEVVSTNKKVDEETRSNLVAPREIESRVHEPPTHGRCIAVTLPLRYDHVT